eukprot:CAMPEP_0202484688 /NCGR_PEP_ID=MMETSP1361-20130828/3699_1 /ASSEMBLY_ACC=CAM_ASM_000849 /TAXON_ID=210615 /ORGANISM="Staurosira complex sp., Strain CCMP2646" /LENGTH=243 /DNA_ID=CAMNT_0049113399 /DNA_START=88 /DNA_END=816 /DNA_ORIENTATION=-
MAGFLFEYAMPGMRRSLFLPAPGSTMMMSKEENDNNYVHSHHTQEQQGSCSPAILASTRYKKIEKLFLRFETMYSEPAFETYIQQFHEEVPSLLSAKEIPFSALAREYRCSYHIFDWMHKGNTAWLMGNIRRRRAAHLWILANDEDRRDCLLNIDGNQKETTTTSTALRLNEATKTAFGQDYHMMIQKKLKKLMWLCEQPFLANPTNKQKRALQQQRVWNFSLQKEEALYLVELYDLPKRISF